MTPERWALLREIFGKALELPESERSEFLHSACRGDLSLHSELQRLLAESAASSWQSPAAVFPSAAGLAPGDTLAHFRIEGRLGEGGMGIVYRAYDNRLQRTVALKALKPEYLAGPDWKHRLLREARAASALNHPNIVTVYEIGSEGGVDFISMEYVEGRSLAQAIQSRGLPLQQTLDYAIAIAESLTQAHAARVIHRDLKPANIMVTADGRLKLLDFGLARQLHLPGTETVTVNGNCEVAGTPHYMSPEQVRGLKLDARTDIFSLGVVLYEMITGRRPFEGDTASHAMLSILEKDPIPVSRYMPGVPGELERIVRKALEKNREERYQVCKDLELDLKKLRQQSGAAGERDATSPGQGVTAPPASPVFRDSRAEHIATRTDRHSRTAALAGLALLVAAAGAYLFFQRTPVFTERDSVLVVDFVNTTGEPVFDDALKVALAIQLQQSPFLSIFPEEQAHDTLRFMGRRPDERITKELGREICQRHGVKVLLGGSIGGLGSHYVISVEAVSATTGDVIAREQVEAESKERVLQSLGAAATKLRGKLGESISSLQKYDRPLEIATTSSLEALKAWSLSRDLNQKGKPKEAILYGRRAIELDPNFAMAYRGLGIYYFLLGQRKDEIKYLQKAFDLRERASEPEKLLIAGDYYREVPRDVDKALETLELLNQIYPRDAVARNQLAVTYNSLGQFEKAIEQTRESLRLVPAAPVYGVLAGGFMRLNRYAEAQQTIREALARFDYSAFHARLFEIAFINGDAAAMKQQIDWANARPDFRNHLDWQADAAASRGQMKQAREFANSPLRDALYGYCQAAGGPAKRTLALSDPGTFWDLAMALALCDEIDKAEAGVDAYSKAQPPTATVETGYRIPELRAGIAIARNQAAQAIELLQPAKRFGGAAQCWPQYLRGLAYLRVNSAGEAMAEFQYIIDHRGFMPLSQIYSLAYLGLARAAALAGDSAKSRRAYQDLFAIWKVADTDLPVLIEAQSEYEKLPR